MSTVKNNPTTSAEQKESQQTKPEAVQLTVIQAINELIKHKQRQCGECSYEDGVHLVSVDLRMTHDEALRIAGAKNPGFIEESMVGIVSKLQRALQDVPDNFVVKSAKKG